VRILIRTQSGKEIILGEMRGGQFFGELSAIDGVKRSANVSALTRGRSLHHAGGGVPRARVLGAARRRSPASPARRRVRELNARLMEQAVLDLRTGSTRSSCACPPRAAETAGSG
jgi:hypothetical protein